MSGEVRGGWARPAAVRSLEDAYATALGASGSPARRSTPMGRARSRRRDRRWAPLGLLLNLERRRR